MAMVRRAFALFLLATMPGGCASTASILRLAAPTSSTAVPPPAGIEAYCAGPPSPQAASFWNAFCNADSEATRVPWTEERRTELHDVVNAVNQQVPYEPSASWDPLAPVGDCKVHAARMFLSLLDRGWPAGALRMATAFIDDGSAEQWAYHVVVLVDTDQGTFVLDNRHASPMPLPTLSYIWATVETPNGHGHWSLMSTDPHTLQVAIAANQAVTQ